ncbi:MAG: ABC transporter permease, partial [Lachnospiraceae bacterium]|nr:ABC transporter permease [Lachnospiraceae bacterium]
MISVMRNTFTLFKKNKEMIYLITIQPIMIFLLMSFLLPYTTMHNIAVANYSSSQKAAGIVDDLTALEGIKVQETTEDKITEKLSGGNAELGIVINDIEGSDIPIVNYIVIGDSEIEGAVELCVSESLGAGEKNAESVVTVNAAKKKWLSISNSLAFMIFKTLTAGNLLGALIIQERKNRMKDRILLSGTKKSSYLLGMSLVYLVFMMIGS